MKAKLKKDILCSSVALASFIIWTVIVCLIDVSPIGALGTDVGLATLNGSFHRLTGVNMALYELTDALSFIPLAIVAGFALLGLVQLIKRRRLRRVDVSILILGVYYVVVGVVFLFFEIAVVNYRPILIEGALEASYPSSTTLLVTCVIPSAIIELRRRITIRSLSALFTVALVAFTAFMVIGRLLSGVHWLSDIIGGALLSTALLLLYRTALRYVGSYNS